MLCKLESVQRPLISVVETNRGTEALEMCLNMVTISQDSVCVCVCVRRQVVFKGFLTDLPHPFPLTTV